MNEQSETDKQDIEFRMYPVVRSEHYEYYTWDLNSNGIESKYPSSKWTKAKQLEPHGENLVYSISYKNNIENRGPIIRTWENLWVTFNGGQTSLVFIYPYEPMSEVEVKDIQERKAEFKRRFSVMNLKVKLVILESLSPSAKGLILRILE